MHRKLVLALCGGLFFISSGRSHRDRGAGGNAATIAIKGTDMAIVELARLRRSLILPIALLSWAAPGRRRNRHQIHLGPQDRRSGSALLRRDRPRLLQGRRPRRQHRAGRQRRRANRPSCVRQLRDGGRRHQCPHQAARCQAADAGESRLHRLRRAALRRRRAQEPWHQPAEGPGGQEARGAQHRRRIRILADLRAGERHQCRQGDDRARRPAGARPHAGRGPGRCRDQLLVLPPTSISRTAASRSTTSSCC